MPQQEMCFSLRTIASITVLLGSQDGWEKNRTLSRPPNDAQIQWEISFKTSIHLKIWRKILDYHLSSILYIAFYPRHHHHPLRIPWRSDIVFIHLSILAYVLNPSTHRFEPTIEPSIATLMNDDYCMPSTIMAPSFWPSILRCLPPAKNDSISRPLEWSAKNIASAESAFSSSHPGRNLSRVIGILILSLKTRFRSVFDTNLHHVFKPNAASSTFLFFCGFSSSASNSLNHNSGWIIGATGPAWLLTQELVKHRGSALCIFRSTELLLFTVSSLGRALFMGLMLWTAHLRIKSSWIDTLMVVCLDILALFDLGLPLKSQIIAKINAILWNVSERWTINCFRPNFLSISLGIRFICQILFPFFAVADLSSARTDGLERSSRNQQSAHPHPNERERNLA